MKKLFVSFSKATLFFGVLLLFQSFSCTTKYLTKDQLPQDVKFLDKKDQFEITFDYQSYRLLPDRDDYFNSNMSGKKGLVIGTILGSKTELYVIEINDATITDFKYVFADKNRIDALKTAANERDKEEAKAKGLGYPSVEAYNKAIREKELYSKPHHWLICEATGYSQVPPSVTQAMLKKFKLEAFDEQSKCADTAWYKNQMANQMGIMCGCVYLKLDRNKAKARVGAERMP